MDTFEVSQVVMTVGSTYQVHAPGNEKVLMTVKGSLMSATPKFSLVQEESGPELASLTGNFIKTKFQVHAAGKPEEIANLLFPAIAFKKTLVLTVGGRGFTADGGLMGEAFKCVDNDGKVGIEIAKKGAFKEGFAVTVDNGITKEIGILAAVAIHSRFFELV